LKRNNNTGKYKTLIQDDSKGIHKKITKNTWVG